MSWYIFAVLGPLCFVAYQALSKLLPKDTSVFLINFYVSLMAALVMLVLHLLTAQNKSLAFEVSNYPLVLAIGAALAFGNAAIIKSYLSGATQSEFTAIFYSALIIYGILAGFLIWKEKFTLVQAGGVALILVGIGMVTFWKDLLKA